MSGAAILAARAALRSGCGLVTAAVPKSVELAVNSQFPEALTLALPETSLGKVGKGAPTVVESAHRVRNFSILALGPGLGTDLETAYALMKTLSRIKIPAVLDADALNILARASKSQVFALLCSRKAPYIFTPHPGEMARLLQVPTDRIVKNRRAYARRLCETWGGVCLLKGHRSIVTDGQRVWVNPTGNAGLAKGGSGDVLTGIIAGLWSQKLCAAKQPHADLTGTFEAAALGAYVHGLAADCAIHDKTQRALLASDVIEALPRAFRVLDR
jgi:NAD(P)H-hydrate epimerase